MILASVSRRRCSAIATPDITPSSFTFTDQVDVTLSSAITSAPITVAGINAPTVISVSGGTYDINGSGSFTSSVGTVNNGDTVRARVTSSASNSTGVSATVTIGGVADTFTATTIVSGGSFQLAAGHFEPSYGTMEIIAPRAGLTTTNRYYKAYPGLLYRVPVAVLYGARPFKYELTSAPSGMTIGSVYGDTDYGIINWSNPVTSGSPHTVAVKVTDQEGTEVTVSWTITVATSGFIFVDSVNGNASSANGGTGTGTLANPFLSLNDWYAGSVGGTGSGTKTNATYAGNFVYYRAGNYTTNNSFNEGADNGQRLPCVSANKPKIHMAYPGEAVTMDTSGAAIIFYGDNSVGYWFQGIEPTNIGSGGDYKWVEWDAGPDDIVFFENTLPDTTGATSTNPAFWMCRRDQRSTYQAYIGNIFEGANNFETFELYNSNKIVWEGGSVANIRGGSAGGYFKESATDFTVAFIEGLVGNANSLVRVDNYADYAAVKGEVRFCNYKTSGNAIVLGTTNGVNIGGFSEARNTWQCDKVVSLSGPTAGTVAATRSVAVHDGSATDGYSIGGSFAGSFTKTQLLAATSGLVDSSTGLLTGTDRTNFLGIRGHEIA